MDFRKSERNKFPVYDDNEGVKLKSEVESRVIFGDNDFITNHAGEGYPVFRERKYDQSNVNTDEQELQTSSKSTWTKMGTGNVSKKTLFGDTPAHFTRFKGIGSSMEDTSFYRNNFKSEKKAKFFSEDKQISDHSGIFHTSDNLTLQQQYSGDVSRFRSRCKCLPKPFKPKVEKPLFTKDELLFSVQKEIGNFLLFDEKDLPSIAKKKKETWMFPPTRATAASKQESMTNLEDKKRFSSEAVPVFLKTNKKDEEQISNTENQSHSSVLKRGLAGVISEESQGIAKVQKQFFTD